MIVSVDILPPEKWWKKARYRLTKPLKVAGYTVPAGFVTDGATVPRFLWPLFPPVGRYLAAAVLHDYLLTKQPRSVADMEFGRALKLAKVECWRRVVMLGAVRAYSSYIRLIG